MDGHTICACNVPSNECVPRAYPVYTVVRIAGSHHLFHVDSQGEELSADDDQHRCDDPMRSRASKALDKLSTRSYNKHIN